MVNKTWFITEGTAGGSNAAITLQWNASDELSMNRSNTLVGRYTTTWAPVGSGSALGGGPYSFTSTGITSLGIFAVGDNTSALPVTLLSFTATKSGRDAELNWITVQEVNNSHFEIERSTDGKNFTSIGKAEGNGTSTEQHSYSFTDEGIMGRTSVAYYRLKQVDFDGLSVYTNTVVVMNEKVAQLEVVSVSPNPFDAHLSVQFVTPHTQTMEVQLMDAFGRLVSSRQITPVQGSNTIDLNETGIKAGIYFVQLIQNGEVKNIRVVKQ